MNISEQIINKSQFETYNTGCYDEVQKCIEAFPRFKAQVMQTMGERFTYAFILLGILVLYQLYVKNRQPEYSKTPFYQKWIDKRLDFIIMLLIVSLIGMLFM